jgi:hypothetical protein
MRIGILSSGGLGYKVLSALVKQIEKPLFIATDSNSAQITEFAEQKGIKIYNGNPKGWEVARVFERASH